MTNPSLPPAQRTRADILAEAGLVFDEIASIKEQIARAKGAAAGSGDYSDSDWFQRTNRALRHKQSLHQRLLQEAGALRRAQSEAERGGFDNRLIGLVKAAMPPEQFRQLVDKAMANEAPVDPATMTDAELLAEVSMAVKRLGRGTSIGSDQGVVAECGRRLARALERPAPESQA